MPTGAATKRKSARKPSEPCLAHHWLCEAPTGEWSHAVCRDCGAERQFRNGFDERPAIGRMWPEERKRRQKALSLTPADHSQVSSAKGGIQ